MSLNPTISAIKSFIKSSLVSLFPCLQNSTYPPPFYQNSANNAQLFRAPQLLTTYFYTAKCMLWCPNPLKPYKKQRKTINKYICQRSTSLLFFWFFSLLIYHQPPFLHYSFVDVKRCDKFPIPTSCAPTAHQHTALLWPPD